LITDWLKGTCLTGGNLGIDMIEAFEEGDLVRRSGGKGPQGRVQHIRVESVRSSLKEEGGEPPGTTVTVLWDNGTLSHFVPNGLEKISTPKKKAS